ncbi:MAG TPA: hypothetical protein VMV09_08595 [Candidatus Saccharimonadales bacterium]|nr:hypothetical protein [Candidatus Saccharimonadales bacterium]
MRVVPTEEDARPPNLPKPGGEQTTRRPWDLVPGNVSDDTVHVWLEQFVAFYNHRYAWTPAQRIPECWGEHGALIEELNTLMWARWTAFSSTQASAEAAQNWHTYSLPNFLARLSTWMGGEGPAADCRAGQHRAFGQDAPSVRTS